MIDTEPICLRPDGEVCGHEERDHFGQHPLMNTMWCLKCWGGKELIGPFCHAYSPHAWSAIGWVKAPDYPGGETDD
jgi:hypothetical protein